MLLVAQGVLLVLALALLLATALPLVRLPFWWIRLFDFPRSQIAVLGVVVLLLYAAVSVADRGIGSSEWAVLALLVLVEAFRWSRSR